MDLPEGMDETEALDGLFTDVRVRLLAEFYNIEQITTTPPVYRALESTQRVNGTPGAYAGIPIMGTVAFALENSPLALLRLQLRGGPEHRPPPALRTRFDRVDEVARDVLPGRVAGQAELQRTYPSPNVSLPSAEASADDANGLLEEMAPTPFISKGTRWVNRSSGEIVEVDHLGRSTDGNEPVVHFKRVSDTMESNQLLLQRDFELMFRPFSQETPRINEAVVEVLKDEEWEHIESGEAVKVDSVDTKRNLVIVVTKEKRKSIPMLDFVNQKWRKIVRKTAYARILDLEDD